MSPLYWSLDDALALRCPVESVGRLREPAAAVSVAVPHQTRERMGAFALAHLCRIAQGSDRAAVEACRELLNRCAPAGDATKPEEFPDWLTHRRLAYQEAAAERLPAPDTAGPND